MTNGLFTKLAHALQEAQYQHELFDHAVIMSRRIGEAAEHRARRAMDDAENKCDRLRAALVAAPPETPADALHMVALAQCSSSIIGDALGDNSAAESEYQNLTRALDGLSKYLLEALPRAQRKPVILGFRSYHYGEARDLFPRELAAILERDRQSMRTAAAEWLKKGT